MSDMAENNGKRLAVLIDADNTSHSVVDGLFMEIATLGDASVRRIYGDFASPQMKGWTDVLQAHAISPRQNFAYSQGKNSADIALVIEAMDLLHGGRVDGFCLVSSDSDFTGLATRIREQGKDVYGFGRRQTPVSFREACRRFIFTENLSSTPDASSPDAQPPSAALPLLKRAAEAAEAEDGWAHLGAVGTQLGNLSPDFDPRNYGKRKLVDLVEATKAFEIRRAAGKSVHIRTK